jgi:hypothetical protein
MRVRERAKKKRATERMGRDRKKTRARRLSSRRWGEWTFINLDVIKVSEIVNRKSLSKGIGPDAVNASAMQIGETQKVVFYND